MKQFEHKLDLLGIPCPQNTAKALIFLELQDQGAKTLILIDDGEPFRNFKDSLELETGFKIIEQVKENHYWRLIILKEY